MGKDRSTPRLALPAPLAPAVVVVGVVAMSLAARHSAGLGLRLALLLSELTLAGPGLLCLTLFGIPWMAGLAMRRIDRRTLLLSLGAGATLWGASLGLLELQYSLRPPPEGYLEAFRRLHEALRPTGPVEALASVVAIALAPALCEEVLFRGIVLPPFVRSLRPAGAVLLSALLFGVIHVDAVAGGVSLYRVPFAIVVGVGLGALRVRTGSLLSPILAHALLNTITFIAAPLTDDPTQTLPSPRPLLGAGLLLGGSALTLLLLRGLPRGVDGATRRT